jgi:SNF2 family DNA or RNA helicase
VEALQTGTLTVQEDELAEIVDNETMGDIDRDLPDALAAVELDVGADLSALDELLAAWGDYRGIVDSKYDGFEAALRASFGEGADRVLVFSYFTGTIDYLAERLSGLHVNGGRLEVLRLYGPMNAKQREEAVERFRSSGGPVVLLSS